MMSGGIPGARWVPPEQFHITLRFIGEVHPRVAEDVASALSSIDARRFDVAVTGCGQFGGDTPRALWAGVEANPALDTLHNKIDRACQVIGLKADKHKFLPHVTLARLRNASPVKVQQFIERHSLMRAPAFTAESFGLYSSALGHDGPHYHLEARYALKPMAA